jgi:hypothetical protein
MYNLFKKIRTSPVSVLYGALMYFFPLASMLFYEYRGFDIGFLYRIYYMALFIIVVLTVIDFKKQYYNSLYGKYVLMIIILSVFSVLWCYLFWGQSPILGMRPAAPAMAIIYFLFLLKIKPSIKSIEILICFFSILYMAIWSYALSKAPEIIIGGEEGLLNEDRGFFRINPPGIGFLLLSFFICVNKYAETRNPLWIIMFTGLFIVIILHLTRQIILFSFMVAVFYMLRRCKHIILVLIGLSFFFYIDKPELSDDSVLGRLLTLSENQLEEQQSGNENTRITAYRFFFTEYSKNIFTDLLGNGFPHAQSNMGKYESMIRLSKGMYYEDVGYATIYVRIGLVGLICYCLIFFRALIQRVARDTAYAKSCIIYFALMNIASAPIYREIITICVCLYILEQDNIMKKNRRLNFLRR